MLCWVICIIFGIIYTATLLLISITDIATWCQEWQYYARGSVPICLWSFQQQLTLHSGFSAQHSLNSLQIIKLLWGLPHDWKWSQKNSVILSGAVQSLCKKTPHRWHWPPFLYKAQRFCPDHSPYPWTTLPYTLHKTELDNKSTRAQGIAPTYREGHLLMS